MREILFRGKRTSYPYEGWAEGSLLCVDGHCMILEKENDDNGDCYPYINAEDGIVDGRLTTVDPETVGQYTGLTDKNGKKIFEGDILHYKGTITQEKCVIGFGEYDPFGRNDGFVGFYLYWEDDKEQYQRYANVAYWLKCTDCICVGNIHDNPELLNEGAEEDRPGKVYAE